LQKKLISNLQLFNEISHNESPAYFVGRDEFWKKRWQHFQPLVTFMNLCSNTLLSKAAKIFGASNKWNAFYLRYFV